VTIEVRHPRIRLGKNTLERPQGRSIGIRRSGAEGLERESRRRGRREGPRERQRARLGRVLCPLDPSGLGLRSSLQRHVKRFLQELEKWLAAAGPDERAEVLESYRKLVGAIDGSTKAIGGRFKPSKVAVLGLLTELAGALGGGARLLAKLKAMAPTIGPYVASLVQAL
jgi:hypothetical protein